MSHPPRQLAKCLAQVNDYVTLVSTRLQDLGEKVYTMMIATDLPLYRDCQVPSGGKTDVDVSETECLGG